jgi:hypothetical protein
MGGGGGRQVEQADAPCGEEQGEGQWRAASIPLLVELARPALHLHAVLALRQHLPRRRPTLAARAGVVHGVDSRQSVLHSGSGCHCRGLGGAAALAGEAVAAERAAEQQRRGGLHASNVQQTPADAAAPREGASGYDT